MPDGQVVFEITGDKKPIAQTLKETTKAIDQESKKWDKSVKQSTDEMEESFSKALDVQRIKNWAIEAGKFVVDFAKQAITAASDLEEVQNVVDVTFGESGAGKIEAWAKKAGTQFGLTETQAKRFTSTLGAMMKSAGMAGPEIVNMSTDLAGLAADMASFYNLDFETAFQKIRSGISGETEPLKQLGINMSVANLQAFALEKGITKAFDKMSQGEQTVLRYQYLMQATADAQGDFARTSDGYANSMRIFETNIETLKTKLGGLLIPAVSETVGKLNELLSALTPDESRRTVLDDFKNIDLETAGKLAEIQQTAEEARALIGVLEQIQSDTAAKSLDDVAEAANKIQLGTGSKWGALVSALSKAGVIKDIFGSADMKAAADNIWDLGYYLSAQTPGEDKTNAWRAMLGVLADNADALSAYTGKSPDDVKAWLDGLAKSVDGIDPNDVTQWETLIGLLNAGLPDLDVAASAQTSEALRNVASAITINAPGADKLTAWNGLIDVLTKNADALSTLRGEDAEQTKAWLETLAEGAKAIDPNDATAWKTLIDTLAGGLPGFDGSEAGQSVMDAITGELLALGSQNAAAQAGLAALGLSTDEIDTKQKQWLETCRRLVQTIPGLNAIINAETGEVKGGTSAISDYVTEWQEAQEKMLVWKAYYAKQDAMNEKRASEYLYLRDMITAEQRVKRLREKYQELGGQAAFDEAYGLNTSGDLYFKHGGLFGRAETDQEKELRQTYFDLAAAQTELNKTTEDYNKQVEANAAAVQYLQDAHDGLVDKYGEEGAAVDGATGAIQTLTAAQEDAARTALNDLAPALAALADYYEDVRAATAKQVESSLGGFDKIVTPAEQAREKVSDLTKELEKANDKGEIQIRIADAENSIPTIQNMTAALKDQIEFLNEYQKNLDEARRKGVSDEILATLSDGSAKSADYLAALASASKGEVAALNETWQELQAGKETLVDTLTAQKLAVDETYDAIVAKANEAVNALDMADGTRNALYSTVEGMASGIAAALPDVTAQVNAVLEQMQRLQSFGGFSYSAGALAFGGSSGGVNYDTLADTIRSSAPKAGGNVYLNGRTLAGVVSSELGNSYRSMDRSGVQYTKN